MQAEIDMPNLFFFAFNYHHCFWYLSFQDVLLSNQICFIENLGPIVHVIGFMLYMVILLWRILTEKQKLIDLVLECFSREKKLILVYLDKGTELILQREINGFTPFIFMSNVE